MDGSFRLQHADIAGHELWSVETSIWLAGEAALRASMDPECVLATPDPWGVLDPEAFGSEAVKDDFARWSEVSLREQTLVRPRPGVAALSYRARGLRQGAVCEALCRSTYVVRNSGWRLVQHQREIVWSAAVTAA